MPSERFRRSVPWRLGDLLVLYACAAVGLLIIGIAWFGAASSVDVHSQVRWTDLGVGGVIIVGGGVLAWVLAGRRAVGELRREVTSRIPLPVRETDQVSAAIATPGPGPDGVVSGPGMTHYHRRDCIFVLGKTVKRGTERGFRRQKRAPCPACIGEHGPGVES